MLSASAELGVTPKFAELETDRVPLAIPIEPVFELLPDKVRIPDPTFNKLPEPEITPDKVLSSPFPAVNVWELAISIFPAPSIEVTVSVASTSYVAPDAIETAVLSDKVPVNFSVPALIVVLPV